VPDFRPAASTPSSPSDPTRDRLIAAAAEVFAEKGYDRAGVQEIARRAGFTTGAIYGRFRGKAELLLAAIEANTHSELDALFAEQKATDILTTVGSHLIAERFGSGQALLLEAFVAARREPEVAALVRSLIEDRAAGLAALIESAKENGDIDTELDTEALVRFCHAVGFGFLLFGAVNLSQARPAPWEALITRLVDALDVPKGDPS
jgi:AcrR family transcriptional regulator